MTKKKIPFWKKSLKIKFALVLFVMIMVIMLLNVVLTGFFLNSYYTHGKTRALQNTFETIQDAYLQGLDLTKDDLRNPGDYNLNMYSDSVIGDDLYLTLEKLSANNNMAIMIYRDMNTSIYDLMFRQNKKYLLYSSLGMKDSDQVENSNIYSDYINAAAYRKNVDTADYDIKQMYVKRLGSEYIYLDGMLPNMDHILIRISVAGIEEGARIAGKFFTYTSLIAAVLGIIVMYMVSNYLLSPLVVLTGIARRISHLDFDAVYDVKTEDEVGVLGDTMNMLSGNLKRALSELQEANLSLQAELKEKEKIDEMRKEFLSNVSHELKTPIALIQGYAEGLADNISDDEESRAFYCDVIMDEAKKMNLMVKKLMNLNQLEFGYTQPDIQTFDLLNMITRIVQKSEILIRNHEALVSIDARGRTVVESDPILIEEVVTNYLTNALNHLDGLRRIDISIREIDRKVRVTVHNTGQPIPEEALSMIWDKFFKVDKARTRDYGGSGVGLSIVAASMKQLGNAYGVQNEPDGVSFWFEVNAALEEIVSV